MINVTLLYIYPCPGLGARRKYFRIFPDWGVIIIPRNCSEDIEDKVFFQMAAAL